jgi:hypothetical protein
MPHSELHKKKKAKNFAVLAGLLGLCALIWVVTMIKMGVW